MDQRPTDLGAHALHALLEDHQQFHSTLQMDAFITTKAGNGHPYGMYLQALRELHARYTGLKEFYFGLTETDLAIAEAEQRARGWAFTAKQRLGRQRAALEVERLRFKKQEMLRQRADREREFKRFFEQATSLKQHLGDLTPERRADWDLSMWEMRLRCKIAVDVLQSGRPSANILEMLPCLPQPLRERLWHYATNPREQVEWYKTLDAEPLAPRLEAVVGEEVRELVCS